MIRLVIAFCILVAATGAAVAVDGVAEINQACADVGCFEGDAAELPVTISTAGSYRLTSAIASDRDGLSIVLATGPIALDLNGFDLAGALDAGGIGGLRLYNGGISVSRGQHIIIGSNCHLENMTIAFSSTGGALELGSSCWLSNSSITGPREHGTCLTAGPNSHIANNAIAGCTDGGVTVGDSSVVVDNIITGTSLGLRAGIGSLIQGNVVRTISGLCSGPPWPFHAINASGSIVRDNVAYGSCGSGISCDHCTVLNNVANDHGAGRFGLLDPSGTSGYASNQFDNNNGGNANPQVSGGIQIGSNVCGGDTTCP